MSIYDKPKDEEVNTLEKTQNWVDTELIAGANYLLDEWYTDLPEEKDILVRNIAAIGAIAITSAMKSTTEMGVAMGGELLRRMFNCVYNIGKADGMDFANSEK